MHFNMIYAVYTDDILGCFLPTGECMCKQTFDTRLSRNFVDKMYLFMADLR